jgi:hypothetical protein
MTKHMIIYKTEFEMKDLVKPKHCLILQVRLLHSSIMVLQVAYIINIGET